eukprot:Em0007g1202a
MSRVDLAAQPHPLKHRARGTPAPPVHQSGRADTKVNALAYADDVCIAASSKEEAQDLLDRWVIAGARTGEYLNTRSMKEVDAGGAVAKMRFLWCNRAFDRRVLQKAFGFAAVRKGERENNALLPLRRSREHVMVVQKIELYSDRVEDVKNTSLNRNGSEKGQKVKNVLLDTSCSRTMVKKRWVPQERMLEGKMVSDESGRHPIREEAAVADTLPVDVLLGTDVEQLRNLRERGVLRKVTVKVAGGNGMTEGGAVGGFHQKAMLDDDGTLEPRVPDITMEEMKRLQERDISLTRAREVAESDKKDMTQERLKAMSDLVKENLENLEKSQEKQTGKVESVPRQHVESVSGEAGLTVKVDKCQFGMKQCVYLGHVVGNGMIQPEVSKVEAVQSFVKLETTTQIGEEGEEQPVGYYSRKVQPREEHYSTVEKECLAIKSLLFGMAGPIKGEQPTSVSLEFITPAYQYEVVHRSGKINRKLILCPEQQQPSLLPESCLCPTKPSLVNWSEEIAKFLTAVNCFGLRQTALIVQAIGTRSTSQVASFKSRYKAKHPIWATYQPSSRLATKWKKTLPSPPQNTPPSNNLLPPHSALRLRYRWPTILVDVCIPFEGRPQALQGAPRSKNLKYEPLRQTRFEEVEGDILSLWVASEAGIPPMMGCSNSSTLGSQDIWYRSTCSHPALDFKFKDLWTRIYPITQLLSSPYCNLTFWRPKLTDAEVVKIISQLFATPITWESATVGDNGPREEVLPNCELGDILDWDVQPSSPLPGTEVDRAQGTGWPFSPISPTQMDYSTAATPRETGE